MKELTLGVLKYRAYQLRQFIDLQIRDRLICHRHAALHVIDLCKMRNQSVDQLGNRCFTTSAFTAEKNTLSRRYIQRHMLQHIFIFRISK